MARRVKQPLEPLKNASSQPDSSLFKLPAELRNRIYELVFEGAKVTIPVRDRSTNPHTLTTCKAIYAEARQIFHNKCHFRLHNAKRLRCWLDNIGSASAKSLTSLEIQPEMGNRDPNYWSISRTKKKMIAEEALCRVDHILQAKDVNIDVAALRIWSAGSWTGRERSVLCSGERALRRDRYSRTHPLQAITTTRRTVDDILDSVLHSVSVKTSLLGVVHPCLPTIHSAIVT